MATVMKWILALLACAMSCMGQLTLQNAHYPTLFKGASASAPPVTGFSLWITPDSQAWTNEDGTTVASSGDYIRKLEDLSGSGNHLYFNTVNVPGSSPPHFDSSYTLGGKRIIQFGQACQDDLPNKTGLITSNSITLIGGMTMFAVSSFLDAPCTGGVQETAGSIFTFGTLEFLFRRYNAANPNRIWTFHNNGSTVLLDPVEMGNSNYQFYAFTFNDSANTTDLWRSNNVVATSADNGTTPGASRVSMGFAPFDAVNSHVNAGLVEFILYTNALTALQISNVNVYLKSKYGL